MRFQQIILVILIYLTTTTSCFSQESEMFIDQRKNYFFVSPISMLDVINPAITFGYERSLNQKIALQFEGGPILKRSLFGYLFTGLGFGTEGAWWTNSGYKCKTELKFYPKNRSKQKSAVYYAIDFFLTKNATNLTSLFEVSDHTFDYSNTKVRFEGKDIYTDFYVFERRRLGFNFKLGLKEIDKNKIIIDSSFGIGLVVQHTKESNRSNFNDLPLHGGESYLNPGNKVLPTITANLKIGFKK
jgi:hypothetical protein